MESFDVLSGRDKQLPGMPGRDAEQLDGTRRGSRDELLELAIQRADLLIERLDALRGRAERELRGLRWGAELPA